MDTNFRLNDRQNSNQLSDKIIDSGEEIVQAYMSNNAVQKILMKDQMTEVSKAIAHRRQKTTSDYLVNFGQYLGNLKNLTEDQNEKVFLDMCSQGLSGQMTEYINRLEQLYGKPDQILWDSPVIQPLYNFHIFNSYYTEKGPFLRGLVSLLATLLIAPRTMAYLEQNNNYVDNQLAKMIGFKDWDIMPMIGQLRQMIDHRADQVSGEEEAALCEIFRRAMALELLVQKHEYNDMKWFDV